MKFVEPFADPDAAARKLVEIASTIEPVQNGRLVNSLYPDRCNCSNAR